MSKYEISKVKRQPLLKILGQYINKNRLERLLN